MSTQKSNQPGEPAHKHVSFTPASEVNSGSDSHETSSPAAGDTKTANVSSSSSVGQKQPAAQATSTSDAKSGSLESAAKSWFGQQQWLQSVDVNQLSKQAQELGSKAKDLGAKAVEQVNRLTPRQKVVGGALLVTGLSWLVLRSKSSSKGHASHGSDSEHDSDTWQRSEESVYRGATTRNHFTDSNKEAPNKERDAAWVE